MDNCDCISVSDMSESSAIVATEIDVEDEVHDTGTPVNDSCVHEAAPQFTEHGSMRDKELVLFHAPKAVVSASTRSPEVLCSMVTPEILISVQFSSILGCQPVIEPVGYRMLPASTQAQAAASHQQSGNGVATQVTAAVARPQHCRSARGKCPCDAHVSAFVEWKIAWPQTDYIRY